MLRAIRAQVQAVLYEVSATRRPALRRSDLPDALFATDLPLLAEADAVELFCLKMTQQGFRCGFHNGWLTLDCSVPAPEAAVPQVLTGECGCCISLLLRHPEEGPAEELIRAVIKAEEAGRQPFERFCASLHGMFAERLRRHDPLPGALLPYICRAYATLIR